MVFSKDVRLPVHLQRAMATEAEAAREARAKVVIEDWLCWAGDDPDQVIAAEGEQKASSALKDAAEVIQQSPHALQVREGSCLSRDIPFLMFLFSVAISPDPELNISGAQLHDNIPDADDVTKHGLNINTSIILLSYWLVLS